MSLQLSANLNQKKIGEEGHIEYSWANNIREKIVQLNFQLKRTSVDSVQFGQLKTQYKKQTLSTLHITYKTNLQISI